MEDKVIYSYSKLSCFESCQYRYYQTYIAKRKSGETIYTFLGTKCHELLEMLQQDMISTDDAINQFYDAVEEASLLGLMFLTEKSGNEYVQSIVHFLDNYQKIDAPVLLEKEFIIDIDGILVKGFVDLTVFGDGYFSIYDYKTSTKFATKDLPKYGRQLVLYAYAMKQLHPELEVDRIGWNMLKYALIQGKRKIKPELRANIDMGDWNEPYLLEHEYSPETVNELLTFIKGTVKQIESKVHEHEFEPCNLEKNSYSCRMCDHHSYCKHYLSYMKNLKK